MKSQVVRLVVISSLLLSLAANATLLFQLEGLRIDYAYDEDRTKSLLEDVHILAKVVGTYGMLKSDWGKLSTER